MKALYVYQAVAENVLFQSAAHAADIDITGDGSLNYFFSSLAVTRVNKDQSIGSYVCTLYF